MKILAFGDVHADASTAGLERFDDAADAMQAVTERAIEMRADLVVFGGDLCDPDSPSLIRCMKLARDTATSLEAAGIPSLWLAGNHDVLEDGYGTTTLDLIGSHTLGAGAQVRVRNEPELVDIADTEVCCLPYTALSRTYDPAKEVRRMSRETDASSVKLVVGHLMLEGIAAGSETEDFPRGRDVFWPLDEIARCFPNAVLVGFHYHHPQTFRGVHLPGSLLRLTRADAGEQRGFLEIEI